jgi:hypothetical protein
MRGRWGCVRTAHPERWGGHWGESCAAQRVSERSVRRLSGAERRPRDVDPALLRQATGAAMGETPFHALGRTIAGGGCMAEAVTFRSTRPGG